MQMGEAGKEECLLAVLFIAHHAVPNLVGLDKTDDTATAKREGLIVGICRYIEGSIFSTALRTHGNVVLVALAGLEGCVDFGSVECINGILNCAFVGGLDHRLIAMGPWESCRWNGNVEKAGAIFAVREIGNRHDGVEVEIFPFFQISDVPPAVHVLAKACGELTNQCHCLVWSRQVLHNSGCRPIQAELGSEITILR